MRRKGINQYKIGFKFSPVYSALALNIVKQRHKRRYRGVHFKPLDILGNLFNRAVESRFKLRTVIVAVGKLIGKRPYLIEKTLTSLY